MKYSGNLPPCNVKTILFFLTEATIAETIVKIKLFPLKTSIKIFEYFLNPVLIMISHNRKNRFSKVDDLVIKKLFCPSLAIICSEGLTVPLCFERKLPINKKVFKFLGVYMELFHCF